TLRVRLGAENSGSSGLAMVPRSYNISVVALTRIDAADDSKTVTQLSVVAHTTIFDEKGKALESGISRNREQLAIKVGDTVSPFSYASIGGVCYDPGVDPERAIGGKPVSPKAVDLTRTPAVYREQLKKEPYTSVARNLLRALDVGD